MSCKTHEHVKRRCVRGFVGLKTEFLQKEERAAVWKKCSNQLATPIWV